MRCDYFQAGKVLAQYCSDNKTIFRGRSILEIGCGLGLTGLAVIKNCEPKDYCFTDNHDDVLRHLIRNIEINLLEQCPLTIDRTEEFPEPIWETNCKGINITVANCSWDRFATSKFCQQLKPDLILAAGKIMTINC